MTLIPGPLKVFERGREEGRGRRPRQKEFSLSALNPFSDTGRLFY